jgi:hypothetical protein
MQPKRVCEQRFNATSRYPDDGDAGRLGIFEKQLPILLADRELGAAVDIIESDS